MRATRPHQPPSFEAEVHELGGIAVVAVCGEVDLVTAPRLAAVVEEATHDHGRPLLVDLEECTFMDSSGLALLLAAHDRLGEDGMAVACSPEGPPGRLLELAARGLVRRYPTRDDALAALR